MANVQHGFRDALLHPDKYNTGVNPIADESVRGTLTEVTTAGTYGGVVFSLYNEDPYLAIRWNNATNNSLGSYVLIENYDFSHFEYLASALESNANIARLVEFKNCILPEFRSGTVDYNISYKLTNCKIPQITGSHFHTLRCDIGHTPNDGIDPLKTVTIEDTYISDICHYTESYTHTDGIQISGTSGIDADNINIINTRIEVPLLKISGSNFGMAGCLFFDIENANSNNVHVENCTVNGAGYSITIVTENDFDISNYTLENVDIGYSHQFGALGTIDDRATLTNVGYVTKLYIGSVWKDENNNTHLSVTNDTNTEKLLIIYTDNGFEQFIIPKCPRYSEVITDVTTFDSLPFDIDLNIGVVDYVVAFDGNVTVDNQIRFVNYTENEVEFPQNFYNIPCSIELLLHRRRMFLNILNSSNPVIQPNRNLINVAIKSTPTQIVTSASAQTYEFILEPNTTYNITKDSTLVSRYGYLPSAYTTGTATLYDGTIPTWNNAGTYQFTTPSTYTYFYFTYTLYEAVKTITIQKA